MTNFRITSKLLFLTMLAFPGLVAAENVEQHGQWADSTPSAESIEESALMALDAEITAGAHGDIHSLLLIRNGKIVFERRYSRDYSTINRPHDAASHQHDKANEIRHPWYQVDSGLHTMQSVSKNVLAALYGIALKQGVLQSVDVPALALLERRDFPDPDGRKATITVSDLLTMRSGFAWDEDSCEDLTDPRNICAQLMASEDWVQFVLEQPMADDPGSTFVYNGGNAMLLAEILQNAVGQSVADYAEAELFAPLGIREYYWKRSPTGLVDAQGGLYLRPRDIARIMQLWLNEGRWGIQQIVSADWVRDSVSPATSQTYPEWPPWDKVGYGYLWWDFTTFVGTQMQSYGGVGAGGQWPVAIPDLNLVIVITGWTIDRDTISHLEIVRDRILPAVH